MEGGKRGRKEGKERKEREREKEREGEGDGERWGTGDIKMHHTKEILFHKNFIVHETHTNIHCYVYIESQ